MDCSTVAGSRKWYQKNLRRLLVDMHINDWDDRFLRDFSPENYAEMMSLAQVDAVEIYAGSCLGLCYWPTRIGFQHRQLHGRDLLGETVSACAAKGLEIQLYLNVWNRAAYEAHPDWRIILYDGTDTVHHKGERFGQCCPNTGFGQFFLALMDELNSGYECRGFWIDMIGNWQYCYCPACQERFRRETGFQELPRVMDWNDPAWIAFMKCRAVWLQEFAEAISDTVKKKHPERTVTFQTATLNWGRAAGISLGFLQAGDFLAADFYGSATEQSRMCKLFSRLSRNRPMEFMSPRCENLLHHTTGRSFENLLMRSYAALANQSSFTLIDAIDPAGTLDRRFYEKAGEINRIYGRYAEYISGKSVPCADIGIYYSPSSLIDLQSGIRPIRDVQDRGAYPYSRIQAHIVDILRKNHLLFQFVHGQDADDLKKIPLIILSDCAALTEQECSALEEYVRAGGRLFASGRTSLYDPDRGKRDDFRLSDLFGVHYDGEETTSFSYIAPVAEGWLPGFNRKYPLMLTEKQLKITAEPETEILGTQTLPLADADELVYFSSAISNPPMIETDKPVLVLRKYGRGQVVYCTGIIEGVEMDCHSDIMAGIFRKMLAGGPSLETNAPKCVECTLFDDPEKGRLVFSCLNLPPELPALPLEKLVFKIHLPEDRTVKAVKQAPENQEFPYDFKDGILVIRLARMQEFEMFIIEY